MPPGEVRGDVALGALACMAARCAGRFPEAGLPDAFLSAGFGELLGPNLGGNCLIAVNCLAIPFESLLGFGKK